MKSVSEMMLGNCLSLMSDEQKMKASVEHYSCLLNVEFDWSIDDLPDAAPIEGPATPVASELIRKARSKMKKGKVTGPSGIVEEMIQEKMVWNY